MSQCVPSWNDIDDAPHPPPPDLPSIHQPQTSAAAAPMSEYDEVAELTWENGHLSLHGMGASPRVGKPIPKYPAAWTQSKGSAAPGGTLEAVVHQATRSQLHAAVAQVWVMGGAHLPQVDALVPSGVAEAVAAGRKRRREEKRACTSQGSAAPGMGESTLVTFDTCGEEVGFTTTTANNSVSLSPGYDEDGGGSPETENTSFGVGHDPIRHSRRPQRDGAYEEEEEEEEKVGRSSISTKRSRAAAIHNQSERKRRDRINQRIKTLQKLVPNSSKTDKASMLDEVIEYLKQLQAQVQMMNRMSSMMMPMAMPQLQMSMMANMAHMAQMAQMGMGMGMGLVDPNSLGRPGPTGVPPHLLHPSAFLPLAATSWDGSVERMQQQAGRAVVPDPFSTFVACQAAQQPVGMDAYNRMAALYQQLYQQTQAGNLKQ